MDRVSEPRALRADAKRNRERIVEAAEAVFARQGIGVPIDDVAREACVGVGTLYRHFPTKEALFEAIVLRRIDQLVEVARELVATGDAGTAIYDFIGRFGCEVHAKRDLSEALAAEGFDVKARAGASIGELHNLVACLLERAQSDGEVRGDITVDDLFALVAGTCSASEHRTPAGSPSLDRMLRVVCDGLRPARARPDHAVAPGRSSR